MSSFWDDWKDREAVRDAEYGDEMSRTRIVNGRVVHEPNPDKIRNDGSCSDATMRKIAQCSDPVPIKTAGVSGGRQVDLLLNQYSQIAPPTNSYGETISYNRKWLASQMGVKLNDLNNALKPDAPAAAFSNLAKRCIRFLNGKIKSATK